MSVDQRQILQAVDPDRCVLQVTTQRQRVVLEFTQSLLSSWCTACVYGTPADDLQRQQRDSDLEDAPFERTDMAAVTEPKDVAEYMVRISCDRFGVCILKCPRSHCMTLMTRRDEPRQFHETRQCTRMTVWVIVTRWTNRYGYSFPTRGEQTTNATATDVLHGRLPNTHSSLKRHFSSG